MFFNKAVERVVLLLFFSAFVLDMMNLNLKTQPQQRVVVVTGASSGIGLRVAQLLIERGDRVYGLARRGELMQPLREMGGFPVAVDITDYDAVGAVIGSIMAECGRIDVLVNNAGFGVYGAVEVVDLEAAKRQFEVNLFAMANLIRLVAPGMRAQGRGCIINVSSVAGEIFCPLGGWYHASKHAVEGLSDCLRCELRRFGVRVVLVEPSLTRTGWLDIAMGHLDGADGGKVYGDMARGVEGLFGVLPLSNVERVAKRVAKIVGLRKPRARYLVGRGARVLWWGYRLCPSWFMDRVLLALVRRLGARRK